MSEAKYREYLEVVNNRETAQRMIHTFLDQGPGIFKQLPNGDAMLARMKELMTVETVTNCTVEAVAPFFDDEALDAAIAFYRSPAGQRFLASQNAANPANLAASMKHGCEIAKQVIREFGYGENGDTVEES